MEHIYLAREVYDEIGRTVGSMHAEQGGALGWREDERVVRYFKFDDTAARTGATYSPRLRRAQRDVPAGLESSRHTSGRVRPLASVGLHAAILQGDLAYAKRILAAVPDLPYLVLPIAQTVPDTGEFRLVPLLVVRDGDAVAARRVLGAQRARQPGHNARRRHAAGPCRDLRPGRRCLRSRPGCRGPE